MVALENALQEDREVDAFPCDVVGEAQRVAREGVAQIVAVVLVDGAVAVAVLEFHVARLDALARRHGRMGDFVIALEEAVGLVTVVGVERQPLAGDAPELFLSGNILEALVFEHLVPRVADVELEEVRPVAFLERIAERQLPALRAHLAGVVVLQLGAQNQRGLGLDQNVGRMFVEVVETEVELAPEERGVETDVEGLGHLPLQVVGTELEAGAADAHVIEGIGVRIDVVGGEVLVVAHRLVAQRTVGTADLQVADVVAVALHESLLRETPTQRHGGEEAPAQVGTEFRGAVVTEREFGVVTVVVVIGCAAENGGEAGAGRVFGRHRRPAVARNDGLGAVAVDTQIGIGPFEGDLVRFGGVGLVRGA